MLCFNEEEYWAKKAVDERPSCWPDEDCWGKLPQFPCLVCPCNRPEWIEGIEKIKAHLMGHFPLLWVKGKKTGEIAPFPQGLKEMGILSKIPKREDVGVDALIKICCWALLSPPPEKWRVKKHLGFYRKLPGNFLKRVRGKRWRCRCEREIAANWAFQKGAVRKEMLMKRMKKRTEKLTKKRCWKLSVLPEKKN